MAEPEMAAAAPADPAAEEPRTFTQEEVTRMCAREAGKAERAILKLLGAESRDALEGYAARYREAEQARESLLRVTEERDGYKEKYEAAAAQLAQQEQEAILTGYGVLPDDLDYYLFKVQKGVTEEKDFSAAAKEYFERKPYSRATVQLAAPMGQAPEKSFNQQVNDALRRAVKHGA